MLHIKYFPIKRFFYQRPLIFVLRNFKGLKLKSSPEIPDYKIPRLVMPSTWF